MAEPRLSTLAFRFEPAGHNGAALDALNRRILEAVDDRGRVHLSGTRLDGRSTIGSSILSFRTHQRHREQCLKDLGWAFDRTRA